MGEFITPPSLPPDIYCRRLLIPNTPEWIGTVTGALMSLIYASEWKQTTGITTEEAANRAREMFDLYLDSGNDGECGDMACCEDKPILHRFNPETGRPEVSSDGGETWTPDPADVENSIPLYPPLVGGGGSSTKCDAATNASEHINELIAATSTQLETAGSVFNLVVAIAEIALGLFIVFVTGGAASPAVLAFAGAIWAAGAAAFSLGKAGFDTYWTSDKQDAILCAIVHNIGENGQFTEAQYQSFRSEIYATLPASPALDIVMTSINAGGARGLSQMASYGNAAEADCDCDDCACSVDNYSIYPSVPGYYGQITGVEGCVISVETLNQNTNGVWYVILTTGDYLTGCKLVSWTTQTGVDVNGVLVGQPNEAIYEGAVPGHEYWQITISGNFAYGKDLEFGI